MRKKTLDKVVLSIGVALGFYAIKKAEEAYDKKSREAKRLEDQIKLNGNSLVHEIYTRLWKLQKDGKLAEQEVTILMRNGTITDHVRKGMVARKGTIDDYIQWLIEEAHGEDARFTGVKHKTVLGV
jgi:hypothetical protein